MTMMGFWIQKMYSPMIPMNLDTDGDGYGDSIDNDIDGDGYLNVTEGQNNSDSLNQYITTKYYFKHVQNIPIIFILEYDHKDQRRIV